MENVDEKTEKNKKKMKKLWKKIKVWRTIRTLYKYDAKQSTKKGESQCKTILIFQGNKSDANRNFITVGQCSRFYTGDFILPSHKGLSSTKWQDFHPSE